MLIVVIYTGIDWGELFRGFFTFQIPDVDGVYMVILGAFGAAVGINMTFLYPYSILAKGWGKHHKGLSRFDLMSSMFLPYVIVTTVLRGASPETVEWEISDVLEEEINTVEGIRNLWSTSYQNVSVVRIEFDLGYEVDKKVQEVREEVDLARSRLPLDVEDPVVEHFDPDAMPIVSVMLGGPVSIRELSEVAEHVVAERIERLPGVGSVTIVGAREREIRIWLDPIRLAGYSLPVYDVASMLRRVQFASAGLTRDELLCHC